VSFEKGGRDAYSKKPGLPCPVAATDSQEAVLFLPALSHVEGPKTVKGRDPISSRDVIRLAEEVDWERQRAGFKLGW